MECDFCTTQKLRFYAVTTVDLIDAVLAVAENRQLDVCEVRPYLMCTSRNQFDFQKAQLSHALHKAVMRFDGYVTGLLYVADIHHAFFLRP